jgi:zinc/manganese transport system ATP-binding protein/zinc transport system ATP-binding protein
MLHPQPHLPGPGIPVIELDNVTCGYDHQPVVANINLQIMPGEFVGLLGPSGSGKTTLLRAILGAVDVYAGHVTVAGAGVKQRKNRIGYVPQIEDINWDFPVTVEEAVLMGRTMNVPLFPWFRRADRELAQTTMERMGIGHLANRHIRRLSGGEQQRVFLARALISNPRLLLLDEPTKGVDIKTRDEVVHLLHDLNHQGITIVMTTHEINAVAAHLPWVVCLNKTIVAEGPPSEVFTPETLYNTYGAEMPVIHYEGMTLVAESPHFLEANGRYDVPEDAIHRHTVGHHRNHDGQHEEGELEEEREVKNV